jgi:hypothetical protein
MNLAEITHRKWRNPVETPDNQPFEAVLASRLRAVWGKAEALTLSIYTTNDSWIDTRPRNAPLTLRKIAEGFLEVACELDAIAGDVAAEDERFAEHMTALGKGYAEALSRFQRDQLTKRLGEIVRAPHKPS